MSGFALEMKVLASACCSDERGFNVLKTKLQIFRDKRSHRILTDGGEAEKTLTQAGVS